MPNVEKIAKDIYELFESCSRVTHCDEPDMHWCREAASSCIGAKTSLISLLSKHPNWDEENMRIHFDADYERPIRKAEAHDDVMHIGDYIANAVCIDLRSKDETPQREDKMLGGNIRGIFADNPLLTLGVALRDWADVDYVFTTTAVTKDGENLIKGMIPDARIHAGQKGTRALNALLNQYGYENVLKGKNERKEYDNHGNLIVVDDLARVRKLYTKFADHMNVLKIKRHTVLSVNPVDFLNMSNGNPGSGWTSCHRVPTEYSTKRSFGEWSAGTWSYAYDSQTIIFYTVESTAADEDITKAGKYGRQLYFWNGKELMPSRLYPQEDNLDDPLYKQHREIVEQVIADCLDCGNLWKKLKYTSNAIDIHEEGMHYPDYRYNRFPIFRPSFLDIPEDSAVAFEIGSDDAICVCCGGLLEVSGYPICESCANGNHYVCSCCNDGYRYEDDGEWVGDEWVCRSCIENYYVWDELNDEYIRQEDSIYVEGLGNTYYTEPDYNDDVWQCSDCGEYYYRPAGFEPEFDDDEEFGTVCHRCFTRNYITCDRCGVLCRKTSTHTTEDGEVVCNDCLDRETEKICQICNTIHKKDDFVYDEAREIDVCKHCYENRRQVCADCGEVRYADHDLRESDKTIEGLGKYICRRCRNNYLYWDGVYHTLDEIYTRALRYEAHNDYGVRWAFNVETLKYYLDHLGELERVFVPESWLKEAAKDKFWGWTNTNDFWVGETAIRFRWFYVCPFSGSDVDIDAVEWTKAYLQYLIKNCEEIAEKVA